MSTSELNVNSATIRKVFNKDFFFYVPDFQRNYAWKSNPKEDATERQVDQLLSDVYLSFKNKYRNYFLGTIITYNDSDIKNDHTYYLIDGQQRITTLSILIRCIAKRLRELKDDEATITEINKYYHRVFNKTPYHVIETSNKSNAEYLREFFGKDEKPNTKDYPSSKQIAEAVKTCENFIKTKLKTKNRTNEFLEYLLYDV